MSESFIPVSQSESTSIDSSKNDTLVSDALESKLVVDYHLTREEIRVIAEAYKLRRKELFRATRKEIQNFINKDYRAANEEALGGLKGVKILQNALEIESDGKFGPFTFRTLIDFQKKKGIKPDGIAGPRTIEILGITEKIKGIELVKPEPVVPQTDPVAPQIEVKSDVTKIITTFENQEKSLQSQFEQLRNARDENTGFSNVLFDDVGSIFGAETGRAIYEKEWESIRSQTRASLAELKATIGTVQMTETENQRYTKLNRSYTQMLKKALDGPEVISSIIASSKALPDTAMAAGYGILGMGKGTIDLVTSIFDITIFLAKMVLPKHRKMVGEQWDQLLKFSEASGGMTGLIVSAFQAEVARVQSLPVNLQSEAMGKISGNVLGMVGTGVGATKLAQMGGELMVKSVAAKAAQSIAETAAKTAEETAVKTAETAVKVSKSASKAAKLSTQASITKTQAIGFKAGSIILGGPAEALMSKITSAAFKKVYLLVQTKKPSPKFLQNTLSRAIVDNAEQKKLATITGDTFRLKELEKQEKFLNETLERLNQIPVLSDTHIITSEIAKKPTSKIGKSRTKAPEKIEPVKPKVEPQIEPQVEPKIKPQVEPKPEKPSIPEIPQTTEPVKPKIAPEKFSRATRTETPTKETFSITKDFIYDAKSTLIQNIRKFRQVFHPDRIKSAKLSQAEGEKADLWIVSFNRVHDTMKQAKNSGNTIALERATQDVERFLRDPAAGVERMKLGQYSDTHGHRESSKTNSDTFLKSMFNRYYTELLEKFSPVKEVIGSRKHIEKLLASDMMSVLKEAMDSGRITANEALTNIHLLRTDLKKFIETNLDMSYEAAIIRRTDAWKRAQKSSSTGQTRSRTGR